MSGILVLLAFMTKGYLLEILAVNIGNSRLKTTQYIFRESKKNIFVMSGILDKREKRVLTGKELKILLKIREVKNIDFFLNILCILPTMFLFDLRPRTRGSGKLANGKDIFYPQRMDGTNTVHFSHNNGVIIGSYLGKKLIDNSATHVLLTASTGSGKGVSIVIPTLVDGCDTSCIIADLKGENFDKSSGYREEVLGNKCFYLNFSDYKSCGYNPLSIIKKGSKNEYSYSKLVAANIVKATTGDNRQEQFWIDSSIMLLQGIILYLLYSVKSREITMNDVNNFLNRENLKDYVKWLKIKFRITREEILKIADYYDYIELKLLKKRIHPEIERAFNGIIDTPDETFTSILMTLKTTLSHFLGSVTREIIKENTFTGRDLTHYKKPISLYLKVDFKQRKTLMPLFNIIISSIVTELLPQEEKGKEYYKNNREIMFLLDEFTNFGRIDVVEETITFTRSFGIKYVLVIQDSNQINKTYDINSSFWSNCKIKCFFNLDDDMNNIELISKLTGTKTIKERPPMFGLLGGKGNMNIRGNFIQKPVISVEEIRSMKANKAILLMGNKTAVVNKIVYYKNEKMLKRTKIKPRISKEL
ncbi:MAG: type IV secretory system conjugative DNA transfer family protein [Fusobacteriales bacterium]|nr:type IV secretory system conjugative DNA transfer family protein [Fusobacteriales bacterium]